MEKKKKEKKLTLINTEGAIVGIFIVVFCSMFCWPDLIQDIANVAKDGTVWEILWWSMCITTLLSICAGLLTTIDFNAKITLGKKKN